MFQVERLCGKATAGGEGRACADSQAHIWAAGTFSCSGVSAEGGQPETLLGDLDSYGNGGKWVRTGIYIDQWGWR